jgi:hypothetical protein
VYCFIFPVVLLVDSSFSCCGGVIRNAEGVKALCGRWKLGMAFCGLKEVFERGVEVARRPRRAIENLAAIAVVVLCVVVLVSEDCGWRWRWKWSLIELEWANRRSRVGAFSRREPETPKKFAQLISIRGQSSVYIMLYELIATV